MCISIPIPHLIPLILARPCHKYELVISAVILGLTWDRRRHDKVSMVGPALGCARGQWTMGLGRQGATPHAAAARAGGLSDALASNPAECDGD